VVAVVVFFIARGGGGVREEVGGRRCFLVRRRPIPDEARRHPASSCFLGNSSPSRSSSTHSLSQSCPFLFSPVPSPPSAGAAR
jgi:hypothetical protein